MLHNACKIKTYNGKNALKIEYYSKKKKKSLKGFRDWRQDKKHKLHKLYLCLLNNEQNMREIITM